MDLAIGRGRGILLQDLPALCRGLFDKGCAGGGRHLRVTDAHLAEYPGRRAAAMPQPVAETGESRMSEGLPRSCGPIGGGNEWE